MKTVQNIFRWLIFITVLLAVISCSTYDEDLRFDPTLNENLVPDARISLSEESGKIDVALGLINISDQSVPVIDDFEGNWVLLNRAGEIRARGAVLTAGPLEPKESEYPLVWSAKLDPDTYTLKWAALSAGTVIIDFEVTGDGDRLGLGVREKETSDAFLIEPQNKTSQ